MEFCRKSSLDKEKKGWTGTIPIQPNDATRSISCAKKGAFVAIALYSDALSVYKCKNNPVDIVSISTGLGVPGRLTHILTRILKNTVISMVFVYNISVGSSYVN